MFFCSRKRMKWTSDHGIIFLCELLLFEPWTYKYGCKERGNCWDRISESLNELKDYSFKATQRSVQDHYLTLEKAYKKQKREEDRQSGTSPEETEADIALADKIEGLEESQKNHQQEGEKQKRKIEEEAAKAEEAAPEEKVEEQAENAVEEQAPEAETEALAEEAKAEEPKAEEANE